MSAAAQPPSTVASTGATAGWLPSAALASSRSTIGSSAQRASNAAPIKCAARSASPNARQAATCRIALQAVDVLHARQASITARAASHSEVLGWIVSRVTGQHFADLLSDRVWSRLGAEEDAYVMIDPVGTPLQGAGLNATARDLARFGEMLRRGGEFNGQRIFDKAVVDDLRRGGDREKFRASGMAFRPGYSYHNQWWILHDADGAFEASGVHGQMVHINPAAEMVIVKLSSHPTAGAGFTHPLTLKAWAALAQAVRQ